MWLLLITYCFFMLCTIGLSLFIRNLNVRSSVGGKVHIRTLMAYPNSKFTVYKRHRPFQVVCLVIQLSVL